MTTLEKLTRDSFAENLNTEFKVGGAEGQTLTLKLVEVSETMRVGTAERFSILFQGAPEFFLQQHTYRLEHDRLGAFEIFLVPISREPDGFRYEAVFNRVVE